MAARALAVAVLLLGVNIFGVAAVAPHHAHPGLREASAKRGGDLARAPDGTVATDAPLPVIHAHRGVNDAAADDADAAAAGAPSGGGAPPAVSLWLLLAMTMVMALLSGVGALPYLFTGKLDPYWSGIANAVGCGVMLAASFDLLEESKSYSASLVLGGIVLGVLAMAYSQAWLSKFEDVSFSDLQGADARKAMLILGVMAAHAFGEGSGVGVSFSGPRGWAQGLLVTIAIGLHNIPEGMAVATIMVSRGTPPRTALLWTLLSALPQGVVAVPSYVFVEAFSGLLPVALGFAAGCMIWIVFAELIPDALETAEHGHVATAATLSAAALQVVSMVIAKLERADGTVASPIVADLRVLLPDLLILAPAFLAPVAAAAAAALLLPSLPASLGAGVGVGTWAGLAGILGGLSHHRMEKHTAVMWAAGGAAACAALWRGLAAVSAGKAGGLERKSSGGELVAVETGQGQGHGHGHDAHHAPYGHDAVHQQYGAYGQALPPPYGAAAAPQGNGWAVGGGAPPPAYYAAAGSGVGGGSGSSSQYNSSNGLSIHATGVAAPGGRGLEQRRVGGGVGGGEGGYVVGGVDGGFGGGVGGGGRLHCNGNCSCKDCDAKAVDASWGAPMDLMPPAERPRDCVRAGLLLGAALLLAALPEAYALADALLRHSGDASSLLPPLLLRGLALGAACAGVAAAVMGTVSWQSAAAAGGCLAALSAAAVGVLLVPLPFGREAAEDIRFDPAHAADRLRAFAAGGLLLASGAGGP
ncbi:hypothetical protein GPECTOR_61g863 [Gonium pectorale]|uniref:ZIP family transporter n=1 Tax=Gonium pectorale TaxID=33097 RepID=A0A150G6D6_GONPE|nr:hypothetical protein GPECTOR_61g863 [Gonium pectorale]|eukprot:KXZ44910.1 hypothetical protein GPECTOR_61g863 [Gonium pectorale]